MLHGEFPRECVESVLIICLSNKCGEARHEHPVLLGRSLLKQKLRIRGQLEESLIKLRC
jgi:hypothetical protein